MMKGLTMLHATTGQATAKIFQFPVRTAPAAISRVDSRPADIRSLQIAKGAFDGAWYHDAAIQDALRPAKR